VCCNTQVLLLLPWPCPQQQQLAEEEDDDEDIIKESELKGERESERER